MRPVVIVVTWAMVGLINTYICARMDKAVGAPGDSPIVGFFLLGPVGTALLLGLLSCALVIKFYFRIYKQ